MPQIEAWVDVLKVERALYNLMLNASQSARHASDNPTVRISLMEDGEHISFCVEDNGPGVPEPVRATLFQPFVSLGKPNGMGLGLTLAQKIAQEHGGDVTLDESRAGHTVFRFSFLKSTLRRFAQTSHSPESSITV